MKIEVWADYACPFCYVGLRFLKAALVKNGMYEESEIIIRSFELDANAQLSPAGSYIDVICKRYNCSYDTALKGMADIEELVRSSGADIDTKKIISANTFDAHRLAHLAEESGGSFALSELIYNAHFAQGKDISDKSVLLSLCEEAGISAAEAEAVLSTDAYQNEVRAEEALAASQKIENAPFFLFNESYALYGAQPFEVLDKVVSIIAGA